MAISRILSDGVANTAISRIDGDLTLVGATSNLLWDKSADDLIFPDNAKAVFGTGSDLQIFHDGSHSFIKDTAGTGNLYVDSNVLYIRNDAGSHTQASFTSGGAVDLYHNNAKKLETTSTGGDVTGTVTMDGGTTSADFSFADTRKALFGGGNDLQIYHAGSNSYILENGTGNLIVKGNAGIYLRGTNDENMATFLQDGAVTLYHDNSAKFETTSTGSTVSGMLHVAQAAGTLPSSSTNGVVIQKNSSTSDNAVISLIGGAAGDSRVEFGDAADRDIGMIRYTHSDNGMEFWTNTSEKMFLNSDGDLGIGTTGPRIHTTTYGTSATYLTITDATAAGVLELGRDTSANDYSVGGIQFFNANNADAANHDADGKVIGAIRVNTVTSDTNAGDDSGGNIIFDTKPEAGSLAERMRITSAGNVGIGSSTANALLHLTGGTDQKLILSGSGSPNINLNSSSGDDFLMQNHAGAFRIYNLTDSRQDLSIDGAGGTTLTGGIGVLSAAGSDSTGSVGVKLPNEKYIAWFDSGASGNTNTHIRSIANVLTLTSSNFNFVTGKVGIGISAPTAALHVYTEGSNYTHGAYLLVESANASMGGNAVFAGLKHAAAIGASYIPLKVTTAGTTLMQLGSAGQLGVGESSVTPANRSPLYHFTHDTDTGMDWVAANTLTFRTGNTERLRIASAGQFGIAGANYGTSGQVLTSQGASAAPQWADAGGGAWTLIGTVVASNSSSLTITGLTSTYDTYAVAISDMHSVNDGSAIHIFLGDSSEVYDDNDYSHHTMSTLCNSNSYAASSSTGVDGIKIAVEGNGNATNEGVGALFYIHTPSDGGTFPQISGTYTAQRPNDGVQYGGSFVGRLNQNITLDRIEIRMGSGNFASGRMTVWGIAHA